MQEMQETQVQFLVQEDPPETIPTPIFLPGKSHGQSSLVGCSPWGGKELDTTEQISLLGPEKPMAARKVVLIPCYL